MGHSLGEYAALVYAHVLSFRDALRLVRVRGELMDRAAEKTPGTMAAVKGVSREALYKIVDEMNQFGVVEITNVNGPSQLTVSGEPSAVEHLIATIRSTRIGRAIQLRVSAPFHSSLMKPISDEFAKYLADTEFRSPKIPVITNVTAMEQGDPSAIRAQLVAQLYSPVLWESSAIRAFELGGRYFVESGPGNVLSGLVRGTLADVTAITGEQALLGA
jgi:[acyl-carrier-protein] S-malonyltransferase